MATGKSIGKKPVSDKVILGIDPGTNVMGYGIIRVSGPITTLIHLDVFRMEKLEDHAMKLKAIFESTLQLIERYQPDELAVEAPFFGKNVQSMLKLGRAQGVAIAAALYRNIPIFEYSPRKIKQAITGNGSASKEQVAAMLKQLLHIQQMPKLLDATDGLAVALCHHFQSGGAQAGGKKYSGWEGFLKANPGRGSKK
ncbi:MAG: crossover junction endodeoxyribonuclease RuvC [Bacteroidia bacterium]|nr:crossover junction endodeoxyribonuclease RuvC [Bacteroidia bacterium]